MNKENAVFKNETTKVQSITYLIEIKSQIAC